MCRLNRFIRKHENGKEQKQNSKNRNNKWLYLVFAMHSIYLTIFY